MLREILEHLDEDCRDHYVHDRRNGFHASESIAGPSCSPEVFPWPDSFGVLLRNFLANILKKQNNYHWHAVCFTDGIRTLWNVSAIVLAKNEWKEKTLETL